MVKKYVYHFANGKADGRGDMKDLLGGKGAGLAEMTNAGLPVPPGFTITTEACNALLRRRRAVSRGIMGAGRLRRSPKSKGTGKKLGDPSNPLLVSVRSGAKFSMPGMMDTVLNLGLNEETLQGLARAHIELSASPTTPIAASFRCSARSCWASTANCSSTC